MDATKVNQKIIELWKRHTKDAELEYIPLFYPPLNKDALLFIGLNPSFGTHWSFLKGTKEYDDIRRDPKKFFAWENGKGVEGKIEISHNIDRLAQCKYSYFAPHRRIAWGLYRDEKKWEHIDVFFYRETKQSELERRVFGKDTPKILNEFGREQVELSKQLILEANPNIVIVANAAARFFNYQFEVTFDEKQDMCITRLNGKKVPTVFISFSRWLRTNKREEREKKLIRDIKRALKIQP